MSDGFKLVGGVGGFPEYLPAQQRAMQAILALITGVFERFGYTPLETAAVEKVDTLLAKGIDAKEVYGLRRLNAGDGEGDKDLALRFDLTVPLARYVVQNRNDLVFPFRRYQVQPVWRGERQQKGRYRQFYQCDIDIVGDGTLPLVADAEILACAVMALDAVGVGDFTVRVNNRKLLEGMIHWAQARDVHLAIKIIDDAEKTGWDKTLSRLVEDAELPSDKALWLVDVLRTRDASKLPRDEAILAGFDELENVVTLAKTLAGDALAARIVMDMGIARGLDYYTGTVMETRLEAAPELGSVMSGGRYENLTSSLGRQQMPGVGISIGLSRLLSWLLNQQPWAGMGATPALVAVLCQDEALLGYYADVAQALRRAGLNVEMHPGGQALGTQLKNAAKRGIAWAVMANADDAAAKRVVAKNLHSGDQQEVALDALADTLADRPAAR